MHDTNGAPFAVPIEVRRKELLFIGVWSRLVFVEEVVTDLLGILYKKRVRLFVQTRGRFCGFYEIGASLVSRGFAKDA